MAVNDVTFYDQAAFGYPGDVKYIVTQGAVASINPGEPVAKVLGNSSGAVVAALATSKPLVGTDYLAGIASSISTDTVAAKGIVEVTKLTSGVSYLCAPLTAATWNTQAKYDALVGARITFDLTAGVYTVNATDNANNGLVVLPLNIQDYPGKVRFAIRSAVNYLA